MNLECGDIRNYTKKVAYQAFQKQSKWRRKKSLEIWNTEIKKVGEEKQTAYEWFLQYPT